MPSPFPGMDPYLEHPDIFRDLHHTFICHSSEALQAVLPEPYYAVLRRRVWLEVPDRPIGPGVPVLHPRQERFPAGVMGGPSAEAEQSQGGVAIAVRAGPRMVVVHAPYGEMREAFIEVYTGHGESRRLVTSIEVLSPTNKTPGRHNRDLYVRKQRELILDDQNRLGEVHLVEIDLLRSGRHTTAVPRDRLRAEAGPFDYHVCIHRFDDPDRFDVYPVLLQDPLPSIDVPLLPEDGAVGVDLQAVFNGCYDAGPYRRLIRYDRDAVVPPLSAEQAEWANAVVSSSPG